MAAPGDHSHDPSKGGHAVVSNGDNDKKTTKKDQILSDPRNTDQSEGGHNASSENNANVTSAAEDSSHGAEALDADPDTTPPSPTATDDEEQMWRDLGPQRVNDLPMDGDKPTAKNDSKSLFSNKQPSGSRHTEKSLTRQTGGDGGVAADFLKLAAQNSEKKDPRMEGIDEIGGDEYRASMNKRLAAERRNRRETSPQRRGRGGYAGVGKQSSRRRSPRRNYPPSPPPTHPKAFAGTTKAENKFPPPPFLNDPEREAQLAEARAFSNSVKRGDATRGDYSSFRGVASAFRGGISTFRGGTARNVPSRPSSKKSNDFFSSPPKRSERQLPATRPGSARREPVKKAQPMTSSGASSRPPVITNPAHWFQEAAAAFLQKSQGSNGPSRVPTPWQNSGAGPAPRTPVPQEERSAENASGAAALVTQNTNDQRLPRDDPNWSDIWDASPRRETQDVPIVEEDLISFGGSSDCGSSEGGARDLRELEDVWAAPAESPEPDLPAIMEQALEEQPDDAASTEVSQPALPTTVQQAHTAQPAVAARIPIQQPTAPGADSSSLLIGFSSPAQRPSTYGLPVFEPFLTQGNLTGGTLAMRDTDTDMIFEMDSFSEDGDFLAGGATTASVDPPTVVSNYLAADAAERSSAIRAVAAPEVASVEPLPINVRTSIHEGIARMRALREDIRSEVVSSIVARLPDEVRPVAAPVVTRSRGLTVNSRYPGNSFSSPARGLASSKWSSSPVKAANAPEKSARKLAGIDGENGKVLKELVRTKKLGGLAASKYADPADDSNARSSRSDRMPAKLERVNENVSPFVNKGRGHSPSGSKDQSPSHKPASRAQNGGSPSRLSAPRPKPAENGAGSGNASSETRRPLGAEAVDSGRSVLVEKTDRRRSNSVKSTEVEAIARDKERAKLEDRSGIDAVHWQHDLFDDIQTSRQASVPPPPPPLPMPTSSRHSLASPVGPASSTDIPLPYMLAPRQMAAFAFIPSTVDLAQVRRVRGDVIGDPWVDRSTNTVRAQVMVPAPNGFMIEYLGIAALEGPPFDRDGNRWFADLFAEVDALAAQERPDIPERFVPDIPQQLLQQIPAQQGGLFIPPFIPPSSASSVFSSSAGLGRSRWSAAIPIRRPEDAAPTASATSSAGGVSMARGPSTLTPGSSNQASGGSGRALGSDSGSAAIHNIRPDVVATGAFVTSIVSNLGGFSMVRSQSDFTLGGQSSAIGNINRRSGSGPRSAAIPIRSPIDGSIVVPPTPSTSSHNRTRSQGAPGPGQKRT